MVRRKSDLETEIDIATEEWVAVDSKIDPLEWQAWTAYRSSLGMNYPFEKLTVPTKLPPATIGAAKAYVDTLRNIRRLHGGDAWRRPLPVDPSAYMGEI